MVRRISLICAAIFIAMLSNAQAAGLELAVGGWRQAISGQLSYQALSDQDIIDLENELNLDDESRVTGRAKIDLPLFLPNIYLMAAPMEFEGTGSKSLTFKFGDVQFDGTAGIKAKLTANQYDVGLYYGLPFVETATLGKLNIDVGLNVRFLDLKAHILGRDNSTGNTAEVSKSVTAPVPMLYLAVQFMPVEALAFEAEGRGISVGDNKLYSVVGRVRYNFAGPLFVAGGYRFDKLELDEEDVVADVEFQGPFLEMGLKF